jgi:hypothetical protein
MDESSSEQGANTLIAQICRETNNVDQVSLYDPDTRQMLPSFCSCCWCCCYCRLWLHLLGFLLLLCVFFGHRPVPM